MIYKVLNFIRGQLDAFINEGRSSAEPLIVLSNPWTANDSGKGASFLNAISLINVEEERIFKAQEQQITKTQNGFYTRREPPLKLNLYILISSFNKNYEDALKFISKVVGYFQSNSVFTRSTGQATTYELPDQVEHIVMELYTASFEQQNQIWASLSTGYLPSVIYKARTIIVESETKPTKEERVVESIDVKLKLSNP